MDSVETLATFFGWCTVINFGFLLLIFVATPLLKFGITIIASIFGVTEEEAKITVLTVIMQYRMAIVLLNLVPYVALKIMA
ncbi:DUF6868 family protein [Candidatus Neomarinimicrobiota bacterium]